MKYVLQLVKMFQYTRFHHPGGGLYPSFATIVTTQECHNITVSQHNSVTTQQCHNSTVSQHNSVTTQNV